MLKEEDGLCGGCGLLIKDRFYVLAVDKQWHNDCLKCTTCGDLLYNQITCFSKDGHIYCKDDYYRLYQVRRCGRCQGGINPQELVMRAKDLVYHLQCFVCVICSRVLNKGDHFGMRSTGLYCEAHYNLLSSAAEEQDNQPAPHYFNGVGTGVKGRPRKQRKESQGPGGVSEIAEVVGSGHEGHHHHGVGLRIDTSYDSASSSSCNNQTRTKRMRTSFKHHQLRTMKSYFAINQNPDAKDLKQLAQKTGLSKRVLQVWFQNARAKWRRNMLRSEGTERIPSESGHKSDGVSPIRDVDNFNSQPSIDLLNSDDGGFSSSDIY
ncbi:unnamed protein product [Allacma fusca]|uniref:Uncharacterized protein n=1 Tax=Allacma fusca TaxID=39272 RepID=A0A8J2PVA5_9HEXA|nr:unnamed protein product [Allacma fusca]